MTFRKVANLTFQPIGDGQEQCIIDYGLCQLSIINLNNGDEQPYSCAVLRGDQQLTEYGPIPDDIISDVGNEAVVDGLLNAMLLLPDAEPSYL